MSILEIIVSVFVIALVLFAMWRVAQLNPVGTGKLSRRVNAVEEKVAGLSARMDTFDQSILMIAERVAETNDSIGDLAKSMGALRVEVAGDRGTTERAWEGIQRLEGFFIQDSFDRRRQ